MSANATIHPDAILLRYREVAAMLGTTERTVQTWVRVGLLEPVRIAGSTRFRRSDVEALAENGSSFGQLAAALERDDRQAGDAA